MPSLGSHCECWDLMVKYLRNYSYAGSRKAIGDSLQGPPRKQEDSLPLTLRVGKAIPSDVGHGRIRIPLGDHCGLKPGDKVIIESATNRHDTVRRITAATVWRARPEDSKISVARIDGLLRRSAGVELGEFAVIRKAVLEPCERLILTPRIDGSRFTALSDHFRRYKLGKGVEGIARRGLNKRALTDGDEICVPGLSLIGEALLFTVSGCKPDGVVIVNPETEISIRHPEVASPGNSERPSGEAHGCNFCGLNSRASDEKDATGSRDGALVSPDMIEGVLCEFAHIERQLIRIRRMISKLFNDHSNQDGRWWH